MCKPCHFSCFKCHGAEFTDCDECNRTMDHREIVNNNSCVCEDQYYESL